MPLNFEPWPAESALRALPSAPVSAGLAPALIGLEDAQPPPPPPEDLCAALFDATSADTVPVAFFTDHYCPNCRSMAETLDQLDGIAVTRHELPVLGEASVLAARAALAAGLQGGRDAFHARMRRAAFAPTEAYMRDLAEGIRLDPDRLIADISGPKVTAALGEDVDLAASLGFSAVPVTVIGRTVLVGDIPGATARAVLREEREDGPACPIRR